MNRKVGVVSALALLASTMGMTTPAMSQDAALCQLVLETDDPVALQEQLSDLLQNDPGSACIDLIVGILGGSPLALVGVPGDPY